MTAKSNSDRATCDHASRVSSGTPNLDDDIEPRRRDVVAKGQVELKVLHVQDGLASGDEVGHVALPKSRNKCSGVSKGGSSDNKRQQRRRKQGLS